MQSKFAATLALVATLALLSTPVSADYGYTPQTDPLKQFQCSGFILATYDNGHYSAKGDRLVPLDGVQSSTELVFKEGKHYLRADNGKYVCLDKKGNDFQEYFAEKPEDCCAIELRDCQKYSDTAKTDKPKDGCYGIFFTKTQRYLTSAGHNKPAENRTWLRSWEYHYPSCPAKPTYNPKGPSTGYGY